MRGLFLVSLSLIAGASLPAAARGLGDADICTVRPDLCDNQPRRPTRTRGPGARTTSLASVNRAKSAARRTGRAAAAVSADATIRSITCRPATVEITSANQDLVECGSSGRGPASVTTIAATRVRAATLSFTSYMNQNANNPALSRKSIANYQTAFADTAKPAILDVTGLVDGSGVRESTPVATSRNNQ